MASSSYDLFSAFHILPWPYVDNMQTFHGFPLIGFHESNHLLQQYYSVRGRTINPCSIRITNIVSFLLWVSPHEELNISGLYLTELQNKQTIHVSFISHGIYFLYLDLFYFEVTDKILVKQLEIMHLPFTNPTLHIPAAEASWTAW